MDHQSRVRRRDLERMLLDQSVQPTHLPLSLLEDITRGFSSDQEIGRGGFVVVYKLQSPGMLTNGAVAVKKLFNSHIHDSKFQQEVRCLMKARHRNVVRFLGYCADTQGKIADYNGKFVMADIQQRLLCFEYLPESLDVYITDASNGLEWMKYYQIIKGICEGLHYLHENHIVHLDMKPSNILLDYHMVPKIADVGLSRFFEENQSRAITKNLVGSIGYFAPEFYSGEITFKLDIYSLGVIISEILTGKKGYADIENQPASYISEGNHQSASLDKKTIEEPSVEKRDTKYQQESVCSGYYKWEQIKREDGDLLNVGFHGENKSKKLDYFVVVDFKATCEKGVQIHPQEIIEFSSVLVDGATGQLECPFHTYVRPQQRPKLTDYCRDLNGIRQKDVDAGVELAAALQMHDEWLRNVARKKSGCFSFAVVTWGNWDCRSMLEPECRLKGVDRPPYFDRWINLRRNFAAEYGNSNRRTDLADAIRAAGMEWEGRPRGASDDARNTARLLGELMR